MPSAIVASGFTDITAIAYSKARHVAVVSERSGRLTLLDLLRKEDGVYESRIVGEGYSSPTQLAIDDSTGRIVVADADGLWLAKLTTANRSTATAFAVQPGAVSSLDIIANPGNPTALAVLVGLPGTRLVRYSLGAQPGSSVVDLLPPLAGTTDAVIAPDGTSALLLASDGAGAVLNLGDFALGTVHAVTPQPLPFGGRLATIDAGWVLLAGRNGQVAAVSRDGVVRVLPGTSAPASPVTAAVVVEDGASVLQAAGDAVIETGLPVGLVDPVLLAMDAEPVFVGGYAPVRVDMGASGLSFDDIELSIKDKDLGAISPSLDDTFDPAAPHLLLAGGWKTGTGLVVAKLRSTGDVVGKAEFEIQDAWDDEGAGPTFAVTGRCDAPVVRPAWGGGDADPQNVDIYKAPPSGGWRSC